MKIAPTDICGETVKLQNADIYLALRPSGAFLSTVLDLAKWDAALYTDRILKQSVRDQMWTPVKLNNGKTNPYGFGWELESVGGHKRVHHGGSLPGFRAMISRFIDDKLTVVVLTNGDNADTGALALGVAAMYIPGLIPERTAAKIDPKVLMRTSGSISRIRRLVLTVTREGDKLMTQQGSAKKSWLPESERTFSKGEIAAKPLASSKMKKGKSHIWWF